MGSAKPVSGNPVSGAPVSVRCPAKLNLFLEVLAKRPDGYHEIESVLVVLRGLHDTLTLRRAEKGVLDLTVDAPAAWGIPAGEGNLVHRAARRLLDEGKAEFGLRIALLKKVPPGAGLGGGSSDAAGLLLALNPLLEKRLPAAALADLGGAIGSDVPFFLAGHPCAIARGRGERLEPVAGVRPFRYVVAYPGLPSSTTEVYRRCAPAPEGAARGPAPVIEALRGGSVDGLREACFNRLAPAARQVCPPTADAVARLEALGLGPAGVTGSGSSCFVVLGPGTGRPTDTAKITSGWPAGAWAGEA